MRLYHWLKRMVAGGARSKPTHRRLQLEPLESRNLLATLVFPNAGAVAAIGTDVYFVTETQRNYNLWKTDASLSIPINLGSIGHLDRSPRNFVEFNGATYFTANGTQGVELWKTDGTSAGTQSIEVINSTTGFGGLAVFDNKLFYSTRDTIGTTDGTPNSLQVVYSGLPFGPRDYTVANGKLYFITGISDPSLWSTDGTSAGTSMVAEAELGGDGNVLDLVNLNGSLYFSKLGNAAGLWTTDGTSAGTSQVFQAPSNNPYVQNLVDVSGDIYFTTHFPVIGFEFANLYKTDGTSAGTSVIQSFSGPHSDPVLGIFYQAPFAATNVNGTLFFGAQNGDAINLWKSDGTAAGTVIAESDFPQGLVGAGNRLFYSDVFDRDLYTTLGGNTLTIDGTAGDDSITVVYTSATDFYVSINGSFTTYTTNQFSTLDIDGLGGNDTLTLHLPTAGTNQVTFSPSAGIAAGANYQIDVTNVEFKYAFGGANDSAVLNDSAALDTTYLFPNNGMMFDLAVSYFSQVVGIPRLTANAGGGTDYAIHIGSDGADNFTTTTGNQTTLTTAGGTTNITHGFEVAYAFAMAGNDTSTLAGLNGGGVNTFYGTPGYSILITPTTFLEPVGFDQVTTNDGDTAGSALLFDGAGNDALTGNSFGSVLTGPGYSVVVQGFANVYGIASSGGNDTAEFDGSVGDDTFYVGYAYSTLVGTNSFYLLQAQGFDLTYAHLSTFSGNDIAYLTDGPGDDILTASGNTAENTYSDGHRVRITAFDTVYASSINGGTNTETTTLPLDFSLVLAGPWT